jgi:hypothetical protein
VRREGRNAPGSATPATLASEKIHMAAWAKSDAERRPRVIVGLSFSRARFRRE